MKVGLFTVSKTESEKDNIADPNATPERLIAEHGIYSAQTPNLDETLGVSPSEREALKRLNDNMRKFMTDFTTHGTWGNKDPKTGKKILKLRSDLDGEACLALFRKAGFKTDKVKYVEQGKKSESGWIVDTGEVEGYEIGDSGLVLVVDHHAKHSKRDTSATKHLYEGLAKFGLLEKNEGLDNFIKFVTKEDNKDYTEAELKDIVDNYEANLTGLKPYLGEDQLLKIFEEAGKQNRELDPYSKLPEKLLENLEYKNPDSGRSMIYSELKDILARSRKSSLEVTDYLASKGLVVDTGDNRFGKVLVNLSAKEGGRKLLLGADAAFYKGYGAYIEYFPESNFYRILTNRDIDFDLGEGINARGRYILRKSDEGEMKLTLADILKKMAKKDDFKFEGGIKRIMDQETKKGGQAPEISEKDFTPEDWKEVEKLAYYIFEHRMSGDEERQKKRAKEYGENENAFLGDTIRSLKLPNGKTIQEAEWTPEAQKFMKDWDWQKAIEIYKRKRNEWGFGKKEKEDEEKAKDKSEEEPDSKKPEDEPDDSKKDKPEETGPKDAADKKDEGKKPELEMLPEMKLLQEQLERAADAYAREYGRAKSRIGLIWRVIGLRNVESSRRNEEVQRAREIYVTARQAYNDLGLRLLREKMEKKEISTDDFQRRMGQHLGDIFVNHDLSLQNKKFQYQQAEDMSRGTLTGRFEAWTNRIIEGYRKMPLWKKIGASLLLTGSGIGLAAAGFTAAAGAVGGAMIGMRVLGGAASAKGSQELMQSMADKWRSRQGMARLESAERILGFEQIPIEQKYQMIMSLASGYDDDLGRRFVRREGWDIGRRLAGNAFGLMVGSGVISNYVRQTVGEWWIGSGGKGTPVPEVAKSSPAEVPAKAPIETPGVKSDDIHQAARPASSGAGGNVIDTSEFDRRIEEARARGAAAGAQGREAVARLGAEAQVLDAQAISGMTKANLGLLNKWLEEGVGNGFRPSTQAQEVLEGIKNLSPGITSDQPLPPTAGEMIQRGNVVHLAQDMFQKFPPLNARETMQQYMERMSRTNFNLFKALSIKNRL